MVLKSLTRKSGTSQLLHYLFAKEEKLVKTGHKPIIIRKNVRSRSLEKWVKEFNKNESYRIHTRKDSVKAYHTILSFSNKDREHINELMLRDIATHYMKLRGEKNLFIGTAHYDKDHVHLHLVMSGTKYLTGETNRLSRAEFQQLKLSLDAYQQKKYPELIHSLPRHGRSKDLSLSTKDRHTITPNSRQSHKEQLQQVLELYYGKSKTLDEFLAQLKSGGHEPYYRGADNRLTGIKFEGGQKFRLSNLGYDKEKIAALDDLRNKEEQQLAELRDLRANHFSDREQSDDRVARSREREMEDDKISQTRNEYRDPDNVYEDKNERQSDDRDDRDDMK